MRIWTGITDDGYGYVQLKPENAEQHDALASLYPGEGFKLEIRQSEARDGCHELIVVPDEDEKKPASGGGAKRRGGYTSMKEADLRTLAAERGIELEASDKRADIIRKLSESD